MEKAKWEIAWVHGTDIQIEKENSEWVAYEDGIRRPATKEEMDLCMVSENE